MAVPSISNVANTDTFQVWLNRTNDLIDIISTKALTASVSNTDITLGNATLSSSGGIGGTFTANTIIAFNLLRSDTFSSKTGGSFPVTFTSPISANTGAAQTVISLNSSLGARSSYSSPSVTWNLGFENTSTNAFIISTSTALTPTVKITDAGEVIATKFTGTFDGNAATTSRFATARSIGMSGDVSWNIAAFDGSSNVTAAATIQPNAVSNSKLRQSVALSVIGNGTSSTANVTDLAAGTDGHVLRRSGTTLGFGALDLANTNATTGVLPVSRGGVGASLSLTTGQILFASSSSAISSNSNLFWDNTNNRLGVGTVTPGNTLHVAGTTYLGGTLGVLGAITANNNITAFTSVTASDIRLKENVVTIDSALDIIENLRGVTFNWKNKDTGGKTYGLIAQEVEKVVPELVYDNGDFKGVAYANIVSILIEAIKELRQEISALK